MVEPRWRYAHRVAGDLEAIRKLSWQETKGFETLKLLSHPVVESMAQDTGSLREKVLALKKVLESTIEALEKAEKKRAPDFDRSDAYAGKLLLRLDPEHERATVADIQRLICDYWKKPGPEPGSTVPLGEGFRKHLQGPLYERLADAVMACLERLSDESSQEDSSEIDLLSLWEQLVDVVSSSRHRDRAIPASLVKLVSTLDEPLRDELEGRGEPADILTRGVLHYARQLSEENRDTALISFRSNLSLTLHIIGEHGARVELGERALSSADILENNLARAEILVDDLGWGNYMRDRSDPSLALMHIDAAQRVAEEALEGEPERRAELTMVVAKAIRHRTLILAEQEKENRLEDLKPAHQMLSELEQTDVVQRELGQISHARALVQAVCLGIDDPPIEQTDSTVASISAALEDVQKAAKIFRKLGDQARYTKALYLECRLHEAAGDKVEAQRVKSQRDYALAHSAWSRPERVSTLNKV